MLQTRDKGVPIHGNWCGPGHRKAEKKCVDALDCVCRIHAKCYGVHNYLNCLCDMELVARLQSIGGTKGRLLRDYFSESACIGPAVLPYVKRCRVCERRVGGRECKKVLCGIGKRCQMSAVMVNKGRYTRYGC